MRLRSSVLAVGVCLAGLLAACPVSAEETASVAPASFSSEVIGPGNPAGLAAEVAALRQRLDQLESAGNAGSFNCGECVCPGWKVSSEFLSWQLHRRDLDYAIATDDSALAVGDGAVQKLGFGSDAGLRVGIARQLASGWEVGFTYTYFYTSASGSAAEPANGNLWATRNHPALYEEAATANAFSSLKYHVFDLEASYQWCLSPSANVKMFGGPRWATIDQQFRANYDGRDFSNASVNHPVDLNAFGLRLGVAGQWELGHGFSLFGRGAGSLMYGRFDSQLTETNLAGAQSIVSVRDEYQQAVPVLEVAAGLSWRYRCFEVSAGYEIVDWFNAGDRSAFVDGNDEGLYSSASTDLLLEGLFARCVWTF